MGNLKRTFYIILIGQFVSIAGSTLTAAAMGFWIYEQTGTITGFALNTLMLILPGILFSPVAGIITDNLNRKWAMILSDVGSAAGTLGILILLLWGTLEPWHVYLLVFVSRTFGTIQWPAYSATITQLVPKEQLGQASGMVEMANALPNLFAPALAGILYVTGGLRAVILIDAITFFVAAGALLLVHIPPPTRSSAGQHADEEPFFQQLSFGWRYVKTRPSLIGLVAYYALYNVIFGMFEPLLMPVLLSTYSEDVVGIAASVASLGVLIGGGIMSVWGGPDRRVLGALGSGAAIFGFMILLGTTTALVPLTLFGFMMLLGMPILISSTQAFWQAKVEEDVQGRVFAFRQLASQAMMPIALLLVGPFSDLILDPLASAGGPLHGFMGVQQGGSLAFILLGIVGLIGTAIAFAVPAIREADLILPDTNTTPERIAT